MKRFIVYLATAFICVATHMQMNAQIIYQVTSPSGHELYYKILNDSCAEVTAPCQSSPCYGPNNSELSGCVIIPSSVNINGTQYAVTQLGNIAFYGCTNMTEVVIPSSVTSIVSAFAGCTGLTKTTYLGSIEQWCQIKMSGGYYPPQYYSHNLYINGGLLTELIIPEGVTSVSRQAFTGCTSITSVHFPSTLVSIREMAFEECNGLRSVSIPSSVRAIHNRAFAYCDSLRTVEFEGDRIDTLADGLFVLSCISNIILPDTVLSLGAAVTRCSYLTSLTLPATIASIPSYFTMGCLNLSSIICRRSIAPTVNAYSFYNAPATTTIMVPCGSINSYSSTWTAFSNFNEVVPYTFGATSEGLGHVEITLPTCESNAIAYAVADEGNRFEMWSDSVTTNPRSFVLTSDSTIHAIFVDNHVEVLVSSNCSNRGSAIGSGSYIKNSTITIYALPNAGFTFQQWNNGVQDNPYELLASQDSALVAIFTSKDTIVVHDTSYIDIIVHDTTTMVDTVTLTEYVPVHDTTYIDVFVHDTTTITDTVTLTEFVPVHDTTYIDVFVHDTTTVVDTVTLTEYVPVHDTTYIDVFVHDTTTVIDTVTLTEYVPVHDTTYITLTDTVTNTVYDTVTNIVIDTVTNMVYDTTVVFITDTLWLHDTVFVHDTIYIHDTIVVGVDEVEAINAKIYTSNGRIVVESSDGMPLGEVQVFDVMGRHTPSPLRGTPPNLGGERQRYQFDVPASGTYFVKIGNHPARKVVVIR